MNTRLSFTVMYFGLLAERRGRSEEVITSFATTPSDLYQELDGQHCLRIARADFRVAVNDEFTGWDHRLESGDRVAFLPPMSGG